MEASVLEVGRAEGLRQAMAGRLRESGWIIADGVEAAFRTVPREAFLPGVRLEDVYSTGEGAEVRTPGGNTAAGGLPVWLQASMILQAVLHTGMSVLEIGAADNGYTAAVLAEVTGTEGRVVTLAAGPEEAERASAALSAAGYGDRVSVRVRFPEHGAPDSKAFTAVIAAGAAWDIPAAWVSHMALGGCLVAPLSLNGMTRAVTFWRQGRHLSASSAQPCGPLQSWLVPARYARAVEIPALAGEGRVRLLFEDGGPARLGDLGGALAGDPALVLSGIAARDRENLADLGTWLAGCYGFCRVETDGPALAGNGAGGGSSMLPFGLAKDRSFAYLLLRPDPDSDPPAAQLCAQGHGPQAQEVAADLAHEVREWDRHGRVLPGGAIEYWPVGSDMGALPAGASVFAKARGSVSVLWPARAGSRPDPAAAGAVSGPRAA